MREAELHKNFWNHHVAKEKRRDRNLEKKIHTDLVWLEIERVLQEGMTVLDAGGGYGRYSLLLAERGCEVYHLDISKRMLKDAQDEARKKGISNIRFIEGDIRDLSFFEDGKFDLVISLDAPVSYAYPQHEKALKELARVSKKMLIISVVNRLGQLPVFIETELRFHKSLEISMKFLKTGNWDHPPFLSSLEGKMPFLSYFIFPPLHGFLPQEVISMVETNGFAIERLVATGTLARMLSPKTLRKLSKDANLYREFLKISLEYDSQIEVLGIGARSASGILIVAHRKQGRKQ